MTEKIKNIFIGLFVISAIAIGISMILFLKPTIGDGKKLLYVRFANVAGIVVGTRVTFAGKPVGEVISIQEVKNARADLADETGRVYPYQLVLKVDSSVEIYNTDEIAIRTTGLMGEKSVGILPKIASKGETSHLVQKEEILYASSIDPLEHTFNQISRVATKAEEAVGRFDTWFNENTTGITRTLQSMESALTHLDTLLVATDQTQLLPSLKEMADLMNQNLFFLKESLGEDQLLQRVASLTSNLDHAMEAFNTDGVLALRNLNQLTYDIAAGTGTLGKLITGEDFYLRFNSLMSKAETLMNDVNHYGLLFQYDKHWQRSRTKKANLLKALDSPKEFRSYFEGEIDTITASLGRLTELLEKSNDGEEKEKIASNDDFKRQFAALLRSVQSLSDCIKLYNQELIAQTAVD